MHANHALILLASLAAGCNAGDDHTPAPPDAAPSDEYEADCPVRAELAVVFEADSGERWVEGATYEAAQAPSRFRDGACVIVEGTRTTIEAAELVVSGPRRSVHVLQDEHLRYWSETPVLAEAGEPLRATIGDGANPEIAVESVGVVPLDQPPGAIEVVEHQPLQIEWTPLVPTDDAELVLRLDNVEHGEDAYLECVVPATERTLTVPPDLIDELFRISRIKAGPHLERAYVEVRERGTAPDGCATLDSAWRYPLAQEMVPAGATPDDD